MTYNAKKYIYLRIVPMILVHAFLLGQIGHTLPQENLSLKSVRETLGSDKGRLGELARDLGLSSDIINEIEAKLPSDSDERLMADYINR